MPLSTSNFETDSRNSSWVFSWVLVVLLVTLTISSYEYFLKFNAHRPSVDSNHDLWSWHRFQSQRPGEKIVLLGASRMQLDISTDYLKERFPETKIIELSINGQYPMATLGALAGDTEFVGTVVVSLTAQALEAQYLDMQIVRNRYFDEKASRYRSLEAYLVALLESRWRFLHPQLTLEKVITSFETRNIFPRPFYIAENPDLSKSADFSLVNIDRLHRHFVTEKHDQYLRETPTEPGVWARNIALLNHYTDAIQHRGGRVILLRLPTSKGHWLLDEQFYPRADYWDEIAARSHALSIHFKDVMGLDQFELPDSSHLDQRDSRQFTKVLFDYIDSRREQSKKAPD